MGKPLVSIIIPCFNAQDYIGQSIESALGQTYPNCEVIVIDDGSTDRSLEIIKSFGRGIRWQAGLNEGGCAARNRGLALSSGKWIQFLDADDLISPQKIENQMEVLISKQEGSVATCSWRHFSESVQKPIREQCFWKSYSSAADLLVDMWMTNGFFSQNCWLVSKQLIDVIGGWNEKLSADQDGEFFGRILLAAVDVIFVEKVEALYRSPQEGNVSQSVSPESLESRYLAWESVQKRLLQQRSDYRSRIASLRRLRGVAYQARKYPDIVRAAGVHEKSLGVRDLWPRRPLVFSLLCSLFGIEYALKFRAKFSKNR